MKYALLIGNDEYKDRKLAQLKTPEADARALAKVLRSKTVGNFDEVTLIVNQTEAKARLAISKFLADKKTDDLILLYFSGHGVLDIEGALYLAVKDTQLDVLRGTAIPSTFITNEMDRCRSKRQILILDCCHSGAFERGRKGEQKAVTGSTFEGSGSGRVVLTASDSTQYALEGDRVIQQSDLSLFTHFLQEGLRTGDADLNQDGRISLDEWYDYSYARITAVTPQQTPHKWAYRQQGELIIARNSAAKKRRTSLPDSIRAMLDQAHLGYQQHRLMLAPDELDLLAAQIERPEADLAAADKRLVLFSALACGRAERWLGMSGENSLQWLRQACLDQNCASAVRQGAAACLGEMNDQLTFEHLLAGARRDTDPATRDVWLDLLTQYQAHSGQARKLPWAVRSKILPRLAQLSLREGAAERARMSRVAASIAPVCALLSFILSSSDNPLTNIVVGVIVLFAVVILAIVFAQAVTAIIFLTRRWQLPMHLFSVIMSGVAFGALLFLLLTDEKIAGLAGGLTALLQALSYRSKIGRSSVYLSILAVFPFILLVSTAPAVGEKIGYAFSASLFSAVYVYFSGKRSYQLLKN